MQTLSEKSTSTPCLDSPTSAGLSALFNSQSFSGFQTEWHILHTTQLFIEQTEKSNTCSGQWLTSEDKSKKKKKTRSCLLSSLCKSCISEGICVKCVKVLLWAHGSGSQMFHWPSQKIFCYTALPCPPTDSLIGSPVDWAWTFYAHQNLILTRPSYLAYIQCCSWHFDLQSGWLIDCDSGRVTDCGRQSTSYSAGCFKKIISQMVD